jgi:hypothetical protein
MMATALLLNWKRPENMRKVVKSIREQTVNVKIFLWNNNAEDKTDYKVDVQINSSQNFFCWPRWLMGSLSETEFIFTLDDDLKLARKTFIKDCIDMCGQLPNDAIIGVTGVVLDKRKDYWGSKHIMQSNGKHDVSVDIVKGRFMFMRKLFLDKITLKYGSDRGEDIYISSFSENKVIPAMSYGAWENLPEGKEALFAQPEHYSLRQQAVNDYYKEII